MNSKEIEVSCPCCDTRLTVDVRTGKVLRSAAAHEVDETGKVVLDEGRWDSASERVKDRGGRGKDAFDSALEKEVHRERDLDDLFDKAKKKLSRPPEEEEPF